MTSRHFSPKQKLFYDELVDMFECGWSDFTIDHFVQLSYGSDEAKWPPYWRQATMATLNRVISKLSLGLDRFTVAKDHKHGRGHKAKYHIITER